MTMLECVHQHITGELQAGGKTDTVVVVTAVFFDLIMLAINSIVATTTASKAHYQRDRQMEHALQYERRAEEYQTCLAETGRKTPKCIDPTVNEKDKLPPKRRTNVVTYTDFYLILFALMTLLVNSVSIMALMTNRDSRIKLLSGLCQLYKDQDVDKYYDHSLLRNYSRRYVYFTLIIVGLAMTALLVPLSIRFFVVYW